MRGGEGDCCVVVVGAGAGGALTATHLVTGLSSRYRVALVDPSPTTGRGAAYSTSDDRHLLNVPASGMSAFPRDPEHFFRWVRTHHDPETQPQDFVPRRVYGDYIAGLLRPPRSTPATPASSAAQESVLGIDRRGDRFVVRLSSGQSIVARAVVLATGSRPGTDWAPANLATSVAAGRRPVDAGDPRGRPAARGHRPDHGRRRDRSRPTRQDRAHGLAARPRSRGAPPADDPGGASPAGDHPTGHPRRSCSRRSTPTSPARSRRPATGGPPSTGSVPVTAQLWQGLGEEDRQTIPGRRTRGPGTCTGTGCLRSPRPGSRTIRTAGRLVRHTGHARRRPRGRRRRRGRRSPTANGVVVGGVVNCTGPVGALGGRPPARAPWRAPVSSGRDRPGSASTPPTTDGCSGVLPAAMPLYAFGHAASRQPLGDHRDAGDPRAGLRRGAGRRTRPARGDEAPTGRRLRTHPDHGHAGRPRPTTRPSAGCSGCRTGSRRDWRPRSPSTRDFTQAHAALALLGHEWGATGSWRSALRAAHAAAAERHLDDREVELPRCRHHPAPHRRGDRRGRAAAPRPAVPARRAGGQRGRADGRLRRPDLRAADRRPGRGPRAGLRRRLVVRRPAGLRPPGPGALERGRGPGVVRPVRGARLRARRPRAGPRLLRDRRARRGLRLARRVDPRPAGPRPTTARTSPGTRRSTS